MEMTVVWTDEALNQLNDIFEYYHWKAGINVARKLVVSLIDKTLTLEQLSLIGQKEELLKGRKRTYYYLVEGNYKIIYWVDKTFVKIAGVFDCRQNPIKMKLIK